MSSGESFFSRWSRLKTAARVAPAPPAPDSAVPRASPPAATGTTSSAPQKEPAPLPPVESLDFDSDFRAFLQPKVDESLKRAALKKLFQAEHFNTMDGLDVYIDDYNKVETLAPEMLAQLDHARDVLFGSAHPGDQQKESAEQTKESGSVETKLPDANGPTDNSSGQ